MQIRIVWEKDKPYFVSDDKMGDCIHLNFGLEYVDDIEIASERFFVYLHKDGSAWKAKIDKDMSHGIIHGDLVHELTAKINGELQAGCDFDIVEYVMAHKAEYAFLLHFVCWIDAYRPRSAGIKPA